MPICIHKRGAKHPILRSRSARPVRTSSPGVLRRLARMTFELESPENPTETTTTMRAATVAHVRASAALRLLAFAASLTAGLVVVTNRQERWGVTVTFYLFDVWTAFVAACFFFATYAVLTASFVNLLIGTTWLHHTDLVMVNLMTAATAGAGAIGSVAMWGNRPSGWYPVCHIYRLYCNKGAVSLVLAFVAYVALGVSASLSRYPRTLVIGRSATAK